MSEQTIRDYSILDRVSDSVSPVIRRLSDVQANVTGTNVKLLRVYKVVKPYYKQRGTLQQKSVLGDFKERLDSHELTNVRINYPFNRIEIFQKRDMPTTDSPVTGIDIMDILPIEGELVFEGEYDKDPIFLNQHDKLVDVFYDERQNAIPMILEITKFLGSFFGKNIVSKGVQLALYRGPTPKDMEPIVNEFIQKLNAEKKAIRALRF